MMGSFQAPSLSSLEEDVSDAYEGHNLKSPLTPQREGDVMRFREMLERQYQYEMVRENEAKSDMARRGGVSSTPSRRDSEKNGHSSMQGKEETESEGRIPVGNAARRGGGEGGDGMRGMEALMADLLESERRNKELKARWETHTPKP
jgi:hypothetical protein